MTRTLLPAVPQLSSWILKDVISQRVLLGSSTHKWSPNLICQQTCWDGWFAVNNSSVGEESPSRKMPSCEQFMVSVWVCSPAAPLGLSHQVFIAAHGSGVPSPLGHTLKASWLPRYLEIAMVLLLACHAWPFSGFILQGWFTSDLHHSVSEAC